MAAREAGEPRLSLVCLTKKSVRVEEEEEEEDKDEVNVGEEEDERGTHCLRRAWWSTTSAPHSVGLHTG